MAARKRRDSSPPGKVCVGAIAGASGIKGVVRIAAFTERPEDLVAYGPVMDEDGERVFEITLTGRSKKQVLATIAGVTDRNGAEALKGTRLYADRARLPAPGADEFYYDDLLGLRVELGDGTLLGTVQSVDDYGAGDVLEVVRAGGAPVLVPFTRAVVPVVDMEAGKLVLDPPPGLLDDADDEPGDETGGSGP